MAENLNGYVVGLTPRGVRESLVNLDNAASTPPFKSVTKAVNGFLSFYSSVHRGSGFKSRVSTHFYEESRQIVAEFVGANLAEHVVIFGKNTTEAINKLANRLCLNKSDVVLISHLEHHSNDLPWRAVATVKRVGLTPRGGIDKASFSALLNKYAGRVKLVAISGASNVTGHIPDIHWFARKAHAVDAQIFVDCAQLAAHRPIRMGKLNQPNHLDYIAISGHKMYAPFGTGALVGRRDTFLQGKPDYKGGGTVSFVTPQTVDWAEPPDRDEAGSPNVIGAIAFASAIKTLKQIGMSNIAKHEAELTAYALDRLKEVDGLVIYGDNSSQATSKRSGVIPFLLDGVPHNLVAAILGYEHGIGVRSGCFCAQPYVAHLLGKTPREIKEIREHVLAKRYGTVPGLVRISFGLYNSKKDIDRLLVALKAISKGSYGKYVLDPASGAYTPKGLKEDFGQYFKI